MTLRNCKSISHVFFIGKLFNFRFSNFPLRPSVKLSFFHFRHLKSMYETDSSVWLKIAIGMAIAAGVGYGVYRYARSR